jgi:hypothetical protein
VFAITVAASYDERGLNCKSALWTSRYASLGRWPYHSSYKTVSRTDHLPFSLLKPANLLSFGGSCNLCISGRPGILPW